MASSDSKIDKPQCGCPKIAELPDVNINTGAKGVNTESTFFNDFQLRVVKRLMNFYYSGLEGTSFR